jgi:hypothetical protein
MEDIIKMVMALTMTGHVFEYNFASKMQAKLIG